MPRGRAPASADRDLPALKNDLVTRRRTGEVLLGELDLPAPRTAGPAASGFGDLDLPAPKGSLDLPAPRTSAPPGNGFGDLDLPAPKGSLDLPALRASAPQGDGFGDLDLPAPKGQLDLPAPRDDFGSTDLPAAKDGLDLPAPRPNTDAIELDLDGPPPAAAAKGRDSFGELELPSSPPARGDEMEFDAVPQRSSGPGAAATAPFPLSVATTARERDRSRGPAREGKRGTGGRTMLILFGAVLVMLGGGGAALGATPYGFFGTYFVERWLPQAGTPQARTATFARADRLAAADTFHEAREGLRVLATARRATGLDRELIARGIAAEALYQVRFGDDTGSSTRISAMLARLDERAYDGPGVALARAAEALRNHDLVAARAQIARARRDAPRDALVDVVAGEIALAQGATADAAERFRAAAAHGGGARASWGLARALLASTDAAAAPAIDAVLHESPRHVAARAAKARLLLAAQDLDGATQLLREASDLEPVDGSPLSASKHERVDALVVLGRLEEGRARLGDAERAYEGALALDATDTGALLGAGRVLLREERTGDALARFDAVLHAGSDGPLDGNARTVRQEATLYAARCATAQDRAQDAKQALTELLGARPEDPDVLLALGHAEQALTNMATAESHFREVIHLDPSRFDGYLGLAQLLTAQHRTDEAAATLAEAGQHVPATADVRRAMGEAELARGAYVEAATQFGEAIALDPNDESALFGLGTASRRAGHFDAAIEALDQLSRRDRNYPGLALERGLVLEARGQSAEAADAYTAALETRPDDADLLLRLGAAQLAAEKLDEAQHTAERVANLRPNSAEAEYLLGRVAFSRGDTANALAHFDRAVGLDATKGEYLLYDAWASLESGNLGKAAQQIDEAVTRDPSLGDAYWIRGEVRLRTGAVQDALVDLQKALVLHPGRAEAFAAIGECYDQLRQHAPAIAAYQRAVGANADNGRWWYRLGSISLDDGRGDAARTALSRAVLLGEAMRVRPPWVADAHRIYGDALKLHGDRALALEQYRRYLEVAPPSAIDRDDVAQTVQQLSGH